MLTPALNTWTFQPLNALLVGVLALGYLWLWRQAQVSRVLRSPLRFFWFFIGLALFALATTSPLETLAHHYLLTARSAQHLLLAYLIAPLLWVGLGQGLLNPVLLRSAWLEHVFAKLSHPLTAMLLFNAGLISWYLPALTELSRGHFWFGQLEHLSVLLAGMLMWLPLLNPAQHQRPTYPRQMFYLMTLILTQVPLFGLLTLSREALYQSYLQAPRITSQLSAFGDQQSAGWLIKLFTVLVFAAAFIAIFIEWSNMQRRIDRTERLQAEEMIKLIERVRARWPQGLPSQG